MATTTAITIYYIGVYVECGLGGWAYLTEDPATGKVSCSRGRASDNLIHREPIYLELMVKILAEAGPDISYVEFRCYHQDIVDWFTKLNLGLVR